MKKPPAGQGPFQRGERLTAAKLNDVVSSIRPVRAGGRAGIVGDTVVSDETDSAYIRVTGRTGANYAWVEVYRTPNGTWANTSRTGNTTSDWAVERNNATVAAGVTVYEARRSVDTSEWIFTQGASGGNVNITSGETVLMILGTYETYKDCPNTPVSPPTMTANVCSGETNETLCVPAYAYAVYQRCGYVWNKIGDTRDYGVWANELNGQSFSAWRRFVIPRWGGDLDPVTGLPDPDAECMGVAFLGTGTGSALTCSCPPCLSDPPEGVELCLKFRTIPRPENIVDCGDLVDTMDEEDAWDKEYVVPLTPASGYCSVSGTSEDNVFIVNWDFQDGASLSCDWGPDVFDSCNPCEHWGRVLASIESPGGGNEPNCGGAGIWTGEFRATDLCSLICDCENGPIEPVDQIHCQNCGNDASPPEIWNAIVEGSVELICCP